MSISKKISGKKIPVVSIDLLQEILVMWLHKSKSPGARQAILKGIRASEAIRGSSC